jgi:hypothetical protein
MDVQEYTGLVPRLEAPGLARRALALTIHRVEPIERIGQDLFVVGALPARTAQRP